LTAIFNENLTNIPLLKAMRPAKPLERIPLSATIIKRQKSPGLHCFYLINTLEQMMKKFSYIAGILAGGLLLAGCSSDHILQMKDGSTVVVQGKPKVDSATGMVIYTDENGQQQAVNQDQIKEMSSLNK
jgi:hypothetical protein